MRLLIVPVSAFGCVVCLLSGRRHPAVPSVPGCASAPTAPGQFSFRVGGVVRAGQAGAGSADSRCQQVRNASFGSYSGTRSALDLSKYSGSVTTAWWPSHCTGQVSAGITASRTSTATRKHHDRRSPSGHGHAPDSLINVSARAVHVLHVEPAPHDAVMLDAEDRNAAHLQPCPVGPGPMPVPLRPARRAPPAPSAATRCPLPNDLARPDPLSWSWTIFTGRCA